MIQKLRTSSFYIISVLCTFGLSVSVAEAASLSIQSLVPSSGTVSVNAPVTFSVIPTGFSLPTYTITDDAGYNLAPNLNSSGYFSWTPISHHIGSHNLVISAVDGAGNSASVSQVITVIQPTATLTNMTNGPGAFVGKPMTFQVTPVGFANPTYWIGDTLSGSTLTNSKLNSSGAFFWVPTLADIGTHKATVSVSDSQGHYVEQIVDITVSPTPKPEVTSLLPGTTTPVGATVSFSVTSPGFTSPKFAVYDSYTPSLITSANLSASGVFSWVPLKNQTGTHNIRITITDISGQISEVVQSIFVQEPALTIESPTGGTVTVGSTVKFTVVASGLSSPTFYVSDNYPGGSSISTNNISASGLFIWTPTMGDVGAHNIAVTGTDTYGNYGSIRKDIKVVPASVVAPAVTPLVSTAPGTSALPPSTTPNTTTIVKPTGYVFVKAMAIGSVGADVTALQQLLVKLGFLSVTPTGTFGPMTATAVKKFQASKGLEQVGSVGPGTRAKLNALGGGEGAVSSTTIFRFTIPLALGASGNEVLQLETRLVKLGYLTRVAGSIYNLDTAAAVKKFQASKGLEQVGSVGPGTRSALNAQ